MNKIKELLDKQAALTVMAIMFAIGAVLTLLGITLTPEKYEAVETIVVVGVLAFTSFGGAAWIKANVLSKFTARKAFGKTQVNNLFEEPQGPGERRF